MGYPFTPEHPLWMLGCGAMAGAMLARWLDTGLDPAAVTIIDPHRVDAPARVRLLRAPPAELPPAALLIGVKPQTFRETPPPPTLAGAGTVVISIMVGIDSETIGARFPDADIVRLMPNLPVALGKGASILRLGRGGAAARALAESLAAPLGLTLWVESDAEVDAGSAVSGSGPAFTYRFIDALTEAAQSLGFAADDAAKLALATVEGAAALAAQADVPPGALAERVASKGGTTRAGLDVLDAELPDLLARTLAASVARAAELRRG